MVWLCNTWGIVQGVWGSNPSQIPDSVRYLPIWHVFPLHSSGHKHSKFLMGEPIDWERQMPPFWQILLSHGSISAVEREGNINDTCRSISMTSQYKWQVNIDERSLSVTGTNQWQVSINDRSISMKGHYQLQVNINDRSISMTGQYRWIQNQSLIYRSMTGPWKVNVAL